MSQMMWSYTDQKYRGQAADGTLVAADEAAMQTALKKAGKTVYDTGWWLETLHSVLNHWGIQGKRTLDAATRMPQVDFSSASEQSQPPVQRPSGPLSTRLLSGPLKKEDLPNE